MVTAMNIEEKCEIMNVTGRAILRVQTSGSDYSIIGWTKIERKSASLWVWFGKKKMIFSNRKDGIYSWHIISDKGVKVYDWELCF